ncbi:MAG: 16S rRNA (guanine(527)-N(7))-methyltransferase RsmG [Actinomycetaceae bacterium]|nr:16S rRNA (guanine(527)-N(7))-methyltransferase RsmG [Actinomycetaceae bacterium]MDY5854419.1 16S rRNA (guanine(527)-N(7))-methyltransferase RsmG [Arcanobacterium sp.]
MALADAEVEAPPAGGASHFGDDAWERLELFAQSLVSEGDIRGLIGPRELERLWSRHILNCTAVVSYLPEKGYIADIGSGAGFPGIVAAILRPHAKVSLIETMERRSDWLNELVVKLDLPHVQVINERAETLIGKQTFDSVTARAVAPLKKLVPWTLPLLKSGGELLALKGARAEQEVEAARTVLKKYKAASTFIDDVKVWGTDEPTRIVRVSVR